MAVPDFVRNLYRYEPPSPEELLRRIKVENARVTWIAESTSSLALGFIAAFLVSPVVEKQAIEVMLTKGTWIWLFVALVLYLYGYWVLNALEEE